MPRMQRSRKKAEAAGQPDVQPEIPAMAGQPIVLADVLDLKAASPLAAALLALRGADVVIDASRVQRIGGQCLQVILSAHMSWRADGAVFEVVRPSDDFVEGLRLFGIEPARLIRSMSEETAQ